MPASGEAISDVDEDLEEETNAVSNNVFKTTRSPYTAAERAEIVEGLVKREAFGMLKGNAIWKLMEKEGVCGGRRSWQSLKEQFKKVIGPEINAYGLDQNDLKQFRSALGKSKKSTEETSEASKYPPVASEGGSRRKTRERREPPASPSPGASSTPGESSSPDTSGWTGKSSRPPHIPGNPRLSLRGGKAEVPNKRKRGGAVAHSTPAAKKGDGAQDVGEDGYVTASQEEEEGSNGNHFYDLIPQESPPDHSHNIQLLKETSSVHSSPLASGSRSQAKKTPKTAVRQSSVPETSGSVATVLERTRRRPAARLHAEVEAAPKRKLRRKSKVGEVFAETPVKAPADETGSATNTDLDDTALSSQEMTVVGDGAEFDMEKIVEDEIDTAGPDKDHSAEKGAKNASKYALHKKSGRKGKRPNSRRSQGKMEEDRDDGNSAENEQVGEDESSENEAAAVKTKTVGRRKGKTLSRILPRIHRIVTGDVEEEEEEEEEEEDGLQSVKKKSLKKKPSVKQQGGGMFRQPYSRQEESSIVNYLLEKGGLSLTGGLKLWQDMVDAEICPGRSAHALKEQFLHHIRKRLHEFNVTEEELREADVKADSLTAYISHNETLGSSPSGRGFREKANYYTTEEDLKMLSFILDNGRSADTGGVSLWQLMEFREVVEGRSWQSLKERFRRSILKRLDSFDNLTADQKQRLLVGGGGDRGKGGRKKKN